MERLSQTNDNTRENLRTWLKVLLILIVLVIIFFVTAGGISHNINWQINRINISGITTVSEDDVRAAVLEKLQGNYFYVYARDNSYLFPKREIEDALLDSFPRFANVSVLRVDDHTISVVISERKPYALWCGETFHPESSSLPDCWFVDNTGFVFEKAWAFSRGVYIEIYGSLIEKNANDPLQGIVPLARFETVTQFATLLANSIGKPYLAQIKPNKELGMIIQSSERYPYLSGTTICFDDEMDPMDSVDNLQKAITALYPDNNAPKKNLIYVDLRFANKVLFGTEASTSSTCRL